MIGHLRGIVTEKERGRSVIIDVQGVGYEVMCAYGTYQQLNLDEEVQLVIYSDMRESTLSLYGFQTKLEKQLFTFLNEVKGVGPRSALEILSAIRASDLLKVIGAGDASQIQRAKGIGKKTAERIVLELQDKVSQYALEQASGVPVGLSKEIEVIVTPAPEEDDSLMALVSLGFSKQESERVVGRVRQEHPKLKDPGDIVKAALRYLS